MKAYLFYLAVVIQSLSRSIVESLGSELEVSNLLAHFT